MPKNPKITESSQDNQKLSVDFEKAMADLENLVDKMEAGDFNLEQSLKQFEQGVNLARQCQQALQSAELKVKQLMNAETLATTDFNLDNSTDDSL